MSPTEGGIVSVEQNGRVLSGVGVESADLEQVMDRHAPPEPKPTAPATAAPAATDTTPPVVKESKGRQRFSELANERKAAEERATTAERERDELKARLAQPPAQAPATPVQQQQPQVQQQPPQWQMTRTKPTEDEIGTKYQTYADFVEDLSDWKAEQRIESANLDGRIRQTIEFERSARSYKEHVEATHVKGRAAYPDFDTVYTSGPGGQVPMPLDRLHAIYQAPNSEHLQYAIMRDAGLAQRLASSTPIEFGMELARLSGTHQPANGNGSAVIAPPPAPMQPVGTGSKTTNTPSSELAAQGYDFDKSGYREKRAAERAASRGRK